MLLARNWKIDIGMKWKSMGHIKRGCRETLYKGTYLRKRLICRENLKCTLPRFLWRFDQKRNINQDAFCRTSLYNQNKVLQLATTLLHLLFLTINQKIITVLRNRTLIILLIVIIFSFQCVRKNDLRNACCCKNCHNWKCFWEWSIFFWSHLYASQYLEKY